MDLNQIKEYVKMKHGSQTRKQGTPYFLHPFAVADILAQKGYNLEYQITGLFHDLLEDTDTTYDELIKISNIQIADAVKLLTKEKNYEMNKYINQINENEIAKAVKLVDRIHNLSEAHYASKEWIIKYIDETKKWYIALAKNTPFEDELAKALQNLETYI